MGHVFVTAVGYGKRVVPVTAPCEFVVDRDGELCVTATASSPSAVRRISHDAAVDRIDTADRVADILEGPAQAEWWLDAGPYAVPLPPGWTAEVTGDVKPAFYLVMDGDRSVFVQTARNRPTIEALVAPGQTVVDRGGDDRADWIELSYEHDGQRWLQRHALMHASPPTMVTAQAPALAFDGARTVQMTMVQRIVFGG